MMSRTLRAFSRARDTLDKIELEYSGSNVRNCVTLSGVGCPYFFSSYSHCLSVTTKSNADQSVMRKALNDCGSFINISS